MNLKLACSEFILAFGVLFTPEVAVRLDDLIVSAKPAIVLTY